MVVDDSAERGFPVVVADCAVDVALFGVGVDDDSVELARDRTAVSDAGGEVDGSGGTQGIVGGDYSLYALNGVAVQGNRVLSEEYF